MGEPHGVSEWLCAVVIGNPPAHGSLYIRRYLCSMQKGASLATIDGVYVRVYYDNAINSDKLLINWVLSFPDVYDGVCHTASIHLSPPLWNVPAQPLRKKLR